MHLCFRPIWAASQSQNPRISAASSAVLFNRCIQTSPNSERLNCSTYLFLVPWQIKSTPEAIAVFPGVLFETSPLATAYHRLQIENLNNHFYGLFSMNKESECVEQREVFEEKCQIWGWILFIVSALFFIATSIRTGDILGLLGGAFFLVACFIFLIPHVFSEKF